jgi:type IV pilus assembly protein PilF
MAAHLQGRRPMMRQALAAVATLVLLAACTTTSTSTSGRVTTSPGANSRSDSQGDSDKTSAQNRASIRMQLAAGYYGQGQYEVALEEIKKAVQAEPENADAYGIRALIYIALGETALAEESFQHALKLAPRNADVSNNYGSFLCENGRVAESLPYFDKALQNRAYPSPEKALNNAGACSLKIKDYDGAERYLLKALEVAPDMPATNVNLARIYYVKRDYKRAGFFIGRVSQTVKMESLTADVLWLAIKVQRKLGDAGAEAGWVAQLRSRHPGSPEYAAYQSGAFDE